MFFETLFDGTGRTEYQKCPLIFFILCENIGKVYIYLYMYSKFVTNILMGFKIWCQVGVFGFKFENSYREMCFWKIMLKVRCFKNTNDNSTFLNFFSILSKIFIFSENSFKGISFVKLTPFTFLSKNLSLRKTAAKPPERVQQKCWPSRYTLPPGFKEDLRARAKPELSWNENSELQRQYRQLLYVLRYIYNMLNIPFNPVPPPNALKKLFLCFDLNGPH